VDISGNLTESEPRNVHYRSALADGLLGVGQSLYRLGRRAEALQTLGRVLDLQKSIEASAPEQLWLHRSNSRAYLAIGNVLAKEGKMEQALSHYQEGLATAERTLRRFPSSLALTLDRAEALESMGTHYVSLAKRPNVAPARKAEWTAEARSCYQRSLGIFQDWCERKIGAPYAERRRNKTLAALRSIERL
jgi:tetratricopeptide (TPR) repeat protein